MKKTFEKLKKILVEKIKRQKKYNLYQEYCLLTILTQAKAQFRSFHIYEREITVQGVMVNPWSFPEAIELVNQLKDRYLDFATLGKQLIGSDKLIPKFQGSRNFL